VECEWAKDGVKALSVWNAFLRNVLSVRSALGDWAEWADVLCVLSVLGECPEWAESVSGECMS
jgi:hypothetical protein